LQSYFNKNGVRGVNNGPFIPFSSQFPKREKTTLAELQEIKLKNRHRLLQILDTYQPVERFGELSWRGGPLTDLPTTCRSGDERPAGLMQKDLMCCCARWKKFSGTISKWF
jgi:hypothetical protein